MRLLKLYVYILSGLMLFSVSTVTGQVTDKEVADLSLRISGVEKVEQLYSIRYAVGRYASRTDLTLRQQQLLMKSMRELSDEFKMRSHFRNAADVYKEYLDYNNNYLVSYNQFAKDSLNAVHRNIVEKETATISSLDAEITDLTNRRAAVSGLKNKYYSFGGFGAIAVVVLTITIAFSRNRAINQAASQINSNREQLKVLNKKVTNAGIKEGSITFSRETATGNMQIINSVIESVVLPEEKKAFQKEINSLQQVITKLNNTIA